MREKIEGISKCGKLQLAVIMIIEKASRFRLAFLRFSRSLQGATSGKLTLTPLAYAFYFLAHRCGQLARNDARENRRHKQVW